MELSEAIRLGSMLKPQGFAVLFDGRRTCALGASLDAIGKLRGAITSDARRVWPIADAKAQHPLCPWNTDVSRIIQTLNDSFQWTREQIADWVETIEQQQDAAALAPSQDAELVTA